MRDGMGEHTPTPYSAVFDKNSGNTKIWADVELVGIIYQQGTADSSREDAEFIVRACNSHDDLLTALEEAPLPTVVGTAFREWYYGKRQAAIKKAEVTV